MTRLLTHDRELVGGEVVDRPNRFIVRVEFDDGAVHRVFLGDPGELAGIIEPGIELLCSPANGEQRSTAYDAIVADVDGTYVSLRAALANDLFETVITNGELPSFSGYALDKREPRLPDHGRTDFRLVNPTDEPAYIEVKSCTHLDDGTALFPDRQTQRGRRHLTSLQRIKREGTETHIVFIIQRPDVERFQPFREVDPEFADRLSAAATAGVGVHALSTAFDPPHFRLHAADVPIVLE